MRTDEEIIKRIAFIKERDFFGYETWDLLETLPYHLAKTFFQKGELVAREDWKVIPRDRESVLKQMKDYMSFAWDKANNKRCLSAGRSMSHYNAWVWLIGDDLGDLTRYQFYGKDNLRKICDWYGWDADQWDDKIRTNS